MFRSNVKWGTYAEFQFKPGTQRVLGDGLLFLPLWQDDTSLLFADIRGQGDDGNNSEGNWGLGLRSIIDDRWIVGGYAYYDRRWTEHSNEIPQLTVGMEALSVTWEARVNGYLPDTNVKTIGQIVTSGSPRAVFDGNTILVVTDGRSQAFETAYWGVDAEIGMLLAEIGNRGNVELRGFVGGFHFGTNENLPNISGPRSRLELRLYDLEILGAGSRLTLGADYQWDAVRKDQFFAMLRVRIPLGFGRRKPRLNRLERRMLDRVVRDVDVVASAGRRPVPDIREPALYDDTGQPVGRISVVDAQTPNVPQAVQGAGAGSTVIADGSRGTINTVASINVQTNQTLRGAGFRVRGARTGATAIFGTRPTIQSTTAAQDVVVVGVDSTVRDLDVVGGRFGIATGNAGSDPLTTGSLIANNRVSGAASDGFNFGTVNGSVSGNTSTGNAGDGFDFGDVSVAATVIDNSSTGNTLAGFRFQDIDGTFSNNTATQNGDDGFEFEDVDGLFSNNAAIGNSDDG
ncbi:MAG: inverse autotransporter beta domain-containing protein, partial [Planctomycetaceae bacterium]